MSRSPTTRELLACAVAAARRAGDHALRNRSRRREIAVRFRHDVKLNLDRECQEKAEACIRARFPRHAFLGEENLEDPGSVPENGHLLEWVIDPIDGTVNFSHGLPMWCSAVAVRGAAGVLAAAVYAPELGEIYTATATGPARLNGHRIGVSAVRSLREAMICTGMDKSSGRNRPTLNILRRLHGGVQKCRVLGSAALDLCRVAAGHADGYFEAGVYQWDTAAAGLIVRRAGGRADTLFSMGGHRHCFLATNGHIHTALRALLKGVLPRTGAVLTRVKAAGC